VPKKIVIFKISGLVVEEPEIPYMPENATENRISSAAHTQKLIANFSCPRFAQKYPNKFQPVKFRKKIKKIMKQEGPQELSENKKKRKTKKG
jgi:hypothetical protein